MANINITPAYSGKVRDIYDLGKHLLLVTTDRISAFDSVLESEIPAKGIVLNQLSLFWFKQLSSICKNHVVSASTDELPSAFKPYKEYLNGRFMIVNKAEMFPVECIVRGYLSGSAYKQYVESDSVCGIKLKSGLQESSKFENPIFTPSTKAEVGGHDENISFSACAKIIGSDSANALRDLSIRAYECAHEHALKNGIIIADTKFEFGKVNGEIVLADEALTPDSSRFWDARAYKAGSAQPSFDKQFVRDWLKSNKEAGKMPTQLPKHVIEQTSKKYISAYEKITGQKFAF